MSREKVEGERRKGLRLKEGTTDIAKLGRWGGWEAGRLGRWEVRKQGGWEGGKLGGLVRSRGHGEGERHWNADFGLRNSD